MQIQVTCKCGAVYMPGLHTHNCKEDTMNATPTLWRVLLNDPNPQGRPFLQRSIEIEATSKREAEQKAHAATGHPIAYMRTRKVGTP